MAQRRCKMALLAAALLILLMPSCITTRQAFLQAGPPRRGEVHTLRALPDSVEEFMALSKERATSPEGGAFIYVVALNIFAENPELGLTCLTVALDREYLTNTPNKARSFLGYRGRRPYPSYIRQWQGTIGQKGYIARSYFQGTSPENGYRLPAGPLSVSTYQQSSDRNHQPARVFIECTGAPSPRPLHLRRDNQGYWKATTWGSLNVGVRPPASGGRDDRS